SRTRRPRRAGSEPMRGRPGVRARSTRTDTPSCPASTAQPRVAGPPPRPGTARAHRSTARRAASPFNIGPVEPRGDQDSPERAEHARRRYQLGALLVTTAVVAVVLVTVLGAGSTSELAPGKPVPGAPRTLALLQGIPQRGITLGN